MSLKPALLVLGALAASSASALASVSTYEDLTEGFYGESFTHNGVTYHTVNTQPGVWPSGETFDADGINGLGHTIIVENSTFFYNDFPEWGSANNTLTFGTAYIVGDNLSIGALSQVTMDLATPATSATVDTAFYENGPWGGITVHFDALLAGVVVASDTFVMSDLGGRDNPATRTMTVSAPSFDQLRLHCTFGESVSGIRMMIDDLTLETGGPACPADLANASGEGTPDGGVDINDLLYFLSAFEGGLPAADLDNDGEPSTGTPDGGVDVNDLLFFLARFEGGC